MATHVTPFHPASGKLRPCCQKKSLLAELPDSQAQRLALSASVYTAGLLLRALPSRNPLYKTLLPTDWKVYAKVLAGMVSVLQLNKAIDWKPPPWLGAIQMVTAIHLLTGGLSKQSLKSWVIVTPVISAIAFLNSQLIQRATPVIQAKTDWSAATVRTGISLATMIVAGLGLSRMMKSGWLSKLVPGVALTGSCAMGVQSQHYLH